MPSRHEHIPRDYHVTRAHLHVGASHAAVHVVLEEVSLPCPGMQTPLDAGSDGVPAAGVAAGVEEVGPDVGVRLLRGALVAAVSRPHLGIPRQLVVPHLATETATVNETNNKIYVKSMKYLHNHIEK